jgi:hypothetical protein
MKIPRISAYGDIRSSRTQLYQQKKNEAMFTILEAQKTRILIC